MLAVVAFWLGGCTSAGQMTDQQSNQTLPEHRPADFTLGVVVFGDEDASDVSSLSARYIVDAAGNLRASVGAGSDAGTYPKITRRLSSEQLDLIWEKGSNLINSTRHGGGTGTGFWTAVQAPEEFTREDFNAVELGGGYLLEIRANGKLMAWESYMFLGGPTGFVEMLAELAWIRE